MASLAQQLSISAISYILPSAECELQLSPEDKGTLNATGYIGMILSAYVWGFLSDTVGRRRLLVFGYLFDGVCNLTGSFAESYWFLFAFKLLNGVIMCGPLSIQRTYEAEFHSVKYRGKQIMLAGIFMSLANIVIPERNYMADITFRIVIRNIQCYPQDDVVIATRFESRPVTSTLDWRIAWLILPLEWSITVFDRKIPISSWRLFMALSSLPSFTTACLIYKCMESPRFLMASGQNDEALKTFKIIYSHNTGNNPDMYAVRSISNQIHPSQPPTSSINLKKSLLSIMKICWQQAKPLFIPPHSKNTAVTFMMQFTTLYGFNTIRLWLPQMLTSVQEHLSQQEMTHSSPVIKSICEILQITMSTNVTEDISEPEVHCVFKTADNTVYVNSMMVGIAQGIAFLFAACSISIVGKKMIMVTGYAVGGCSALALLWSHNSDMTIIFSAIYIALLAVSHTVSMAVVIDAFPTSLRNTAVSLSLMFGQLGTIIGNTAFPVLLRMTCSTPFIIISFMTMVNAGLTMFLPETVCAS
ncbi:synaptic vesicle glycoprotein 2B-like [Schistocerca serialis cubense]|uniref:synaptic vesicle glycoprotein 2B-like n=1 Tax=Schistocerca serialis cubense TaxID=2023355 RepID=UPI00214EC87A|nr:synaptic vesicle glycoprotein 2B-like [Schistocerca serialis cubense]